MTWCPAHGSVAEQRGKYIDTYFPAGDIAVVTDAARILPYAFFQSKEC